MKLSIVTINRSNAEGLRKTIESVVSQSFNDFEYIVIDGASTDSSVDVIKEYQDKITYWVSEPDSGVYQAMNKGIRQVKGDYILFLNSGDFLIGSDVLDRVMSQSKGADVLCARCNVSDNGNVVWTSNPPEQITVGVLYGVGLAHQSTFIKRELFEKHGLYREDFKYNSDIDFWYRTIIFGGASTQKIDVITTDYNLDGISSKQSESQQYKAEMEEILSHPFLRKVLPDYECMRQERERLRVMMWVKSKSFLYKPLSCLYNISSLLKKKD